MSLETRGFDRGLMKENMEALAENPYPGRGIILGVSEAGDQAVQAYWVMGRSENSRNRVLVEKNDEVKTEPYDPSKVEDPSLIIYRAMMTTLTSGYRAHHIVSNGNQTETVHRRLDLGHRGEAVFEGFVGALLTRDYEPDAPNFTPRISGYTFISTHQDTQRLYTGHQYGYSIIRRSSTTGMTEHTFGKGELADIPDGAGICLHTYQGDGNPLPSFSGSPYAVELEGDARSITEGLWNILDSENRVALAVKTIDMSSGEADIQIVNQLADKE